MSKRIDRHNRLTSTIIGRAMMGWVFRGYRVKWCMRSGEQDFSPDIRSLSVAFRILRDIVSTDKSLVRVWSRPKGWYRG